MDDEESEIEKTVDKNEDMETERRHHEDSSTLCDSNDDEIDEFIQLQMHLEPKYQRYAMWRI